MGGVECAPKPVVEVVGLVAGHNAGVRAPSIGYPLYRRSRWVPEARSSGDGWYTGPSHRRPDRYRESSVSMGQSRIV